MAYTTKYKYVWVEGYWYSTKRWVSTTYYVPKTYWVWVPGHRYGWGWLSVWVPGHYELRVKWVKKTTGFWLTTWHYKKGYWKKIAYKVQVSTPTKTTKVVVNALTLNQAQGIVQNHPNAFQYDARSTLQEQLKDPDQQASLMLVGGAAMCATGNPVLLHLGAECIKESIYMYFEIDPYAQFPK